MKSASLHSFTLSDQPLGLRRRNKVFQIKYYPVWDSIEYSGGDFFENPWRFTALYSVGRRPCFAQSRTIILRQGRLNEQYQNFIFVKSDLQPLNCVWQEILFVS